MSIEKFDFWFFLVHIIKGAVLPNDMESITISHYKDPF